MIDDLGLRDVGSDALELHPMLIEGQQGEHGFTDLRTVKMAATSQEYCCLQSTCHTTSQE